MNDTNKHDDGGPAFPQNDFILNHINNHDGMSLRDWFAATLRVVSDSDCSVDGFDYEACKFMAGRPMPKSDDMMEVVRWYADVEAAIRYVKADAMLAARNRRNAK